MKYRVLTGLDYPVKGEYKRAEPGDIVDDIPEKSIGWLLRQGHIEELPSVQASAGPVNVGAKAFGGDK